MNFKDIKRVLIAKTKDKSNMPDWYYKRLEKCIGCEFNSGNVEKLSFKDRLRLSHNFGKDACLKCTCGVEDKSSDPVEECPEGFWIKEKDFILDNLNISTESKKGVFSYDNTYKKYLLDYGVIPYQFDSSVKLLILDKEVKELKISTSCGCTTAKPVETNEGTEIEIKYDTLRLGIFNKSIRLNYKINNKQKQTVISIKGQVKK